MFIITADLVKPLNRDEVPQLKGIDGLKTGSPLGVEPPGGDGISGNTGFSTGAATDGTAVKPKTMVPAVPLAAPAPAPVPAKTEAQPAAATKGSSPGN